MACFTSQVLAQYVAIAIIKTPFIKQLNDVYSITTAVFIFDF